MTRSATNSPADSLLRRGATMRRMTAADDLQSHAGELAQCALDAVQRRFPHKLDHLILDAQDRALPEQMHPVFFGSYDWHSSVHMHWSLLRLRERVPPLAAVIAAQFDRHFTPERVEVERRYAAAPGR